MLLRAVRTSCLEMGYLALGDESAPPIVLVHGFPDDARCWNPIAAALAERLGHGRLLATGGGGYHRPNIAAGWNAVVEGLFG